MLFYFNSTVEEDTFRKKKKLFNIVHPESRKENRNRWQIHL